MWLTKITSLWLLQLRHLFCLFLRSRDVSMINGWRDLDNQMKSTTAQFVNTWWLPQGTLSKVLSLWTQSFPNGHGAYNKVVIYSATIGCVTFLMLESGIFWQKFINLWESHKRHSQVPNSKSLKRDMRSWMAIVPSVLKRSPRESLVKP